MAHLGIADPTAWGISLIAWVHFFPFRSPYLLLTTYYVRLGTNHRLVSIKTMVMKFISYTIVRGVHTYVIIVLPVAYYQR